MSLHPKAPFPRSRCVLCRSRPRGSIHSLLPSSLCLDHSHCLVLAPATLAALPSTRAIPDRDVFYVARPTRSILTSYFVTWDPQSDSFRLTDSLMLNDAGDSIACSERVRGARDR